jgi:phage baseplate assembly protein W
VTRPASRAWRFVHPDLDAAEPWIGLGLTARGSVAMVDGSDSVRQSLLLLLTTLPGERVMRPAYGCELYRLVFWPNDDTTAGLAIHYVRRAVEQWEPRARLLAVDANANPDVPERLDVNLDYVALPTGRRDRLDIEVDLGGR